MFVVRNGLKKEQAILKCRNMNGQRLFLNVLTSCYQKMKMKTAERCFLTLVRKPSIKDMIANARENAGKEKYTYLVGEQLQFF